MLPLLPDNNYLAEIMVFGGQSVKVTSGDKVNSIACSESLRLKVFGPNATNPSFTFGEGWVQEDMLSPRIMPDVVLLPNGHVIVLNGAMYGLSGGSQGSSYAYYPNFRAQMYDPYAALGSRWSTLTRLVHTYGCDDVVSHFA